MGNAKNLIVRPVSPSDAARVVKAFHYSGKVVRNSQLHLGVFLNGRCGGAMQFGPSLDKRKLQNLVEGTLWNEFLELNRMAFADWLPRNSESRCIGYAMRWIRRTYPHIRWIVSFADGAQCGDGTIYRASGFVLTGIKVNNQIWKSDLGDRVVSRMTVTKSKHILKTGASSTRSLREAGWRPLPGFQLRYVFFLDQSARRRLTVPEIPFSEIARRGAGMYLGKPRAGGADSGTPGHQPGGGGAIPTPALSSTGERDG